MTKARFSETKTGSASVINVRTTFDIEEACHEINRINRRAKKEAKEHTERERTRPTLSASLDEWLKKPVP